MKDFIDSLLFPEKECLLCGSGIHNNQKHHLRKVELSRDERRIYKRIDGIKQACGSCKENIEVPTIPYCHKCHKPIVKALTEDAHKDLVCGDCSKHHNEYLRQNRSAVLYNSYIQEKIALYKFRGKESLSEVFSYLLITAYDTYYLKEEIDIITYIPLHYNRLLERGFNQSEQLAQKLGEYIGLPVLDTLIRTKEMAKQSKKSRRERLMEIEGAFQLKESTIPLIENKKILIIDDIYTTGSTLTEAAREISKSGPKDILSLTLARAIDQKKDDKMDFFV